MNDKNLVIGFAVLAAFLMVSTSFVSAVSASKVLDANYDGDDSIGDLVGELASLGPVRAAVKTILAFPNDQDSKIEYLSDIVSVFESNPSFQRLVDTVYSSYRDEFDRLDSGTSDGDDIPEDFPDHIESDHVMIQDVFEFTFIQPKFRYRYLGSFFEKFLDLFPVFERFFNVRDNEEIVRLDTGGSVSLYHKGSRDPVIYGPIYKINSFLLVLEACVKDCSSDDFNLENYCNERDAIKDILHDENMEIIVKSIISDIDFKNRINDIVSIPVKERSDAMNSIMEDIENHGLLSDLESRVYEILEENNAETLLGFSGTVLASICWFIAICCFTLAESCIWAALWAFPIFFLAPIFFALGVQFTIWGFYCLFI